MLLCRYFGVALGTPLTAWPSDPGLATPSAKKCNDRPVRKSLEIRRLAGLSSTSEEPADRSCNGSLTHYARRHHGSHTDFLSKAQHKELRRFVTLAYERELETELEALEAQFREWHAGNLDVHQLRDLIHQFHDGVARGLYVMYTRGQLERQAVARNVLQENDLPANLRERLRGRIALFCGGFGSPDGPSVGIPGESEAT